MGRFALGLVVMAALAGAQIVAQATQLTPEQIAEFRRGAYPSDTKGLTLPNVLREIKPRYTSDGMKEKIQGDVELEVIVGVDGTVTKARVVKSLDRLYGLDAAALEAARAWLFKPGMLDGKPVPVIAQLVLNFRLH